MRDPQLELEHLRALASANPTKRFDKLLKLVRHATFLAQAWDRVRTNTGSRTPGVDGQTKASITDQTITRLAQDLKERQYRPQPVRRVYIPKGRNQRRGLGIPTLRDRIVQAAVAQVLEAIYDPIFRSCSYGFRRGYSTIHALRHVARAYRTGATWVIEGDLVKCFDSIPHAVILKCLRKRIKDERFIDLIRQMLQAGVMEHGRRSETYSGTPQGGLVSPILANIVLHDFDVWMEDQQQANPPPQTAKQQEARKNPEYVRLTRQLSYYRAQLHGRQPLGRQTPEGLKRKVRTIQAARERVPCLHPRRALYYCRYADDYVVVLCEYSKAEATHLKDAMAQWLQDQLGLTQHPEKTQITHWSKPLRFLGYNLRGQRNLNGTHWLRLTIPPEAERKLKAKIKRVCGYTQIPTLDLVLSVNAQLRGWTQYYRYASNAPQRYTYLAGVVFWLTAHHLGRKHRCSIKHVLRTQYGPDPKNGRRALYTTRPDGSKLFVWHVPPHKQSILTSRVGAQDNQPVSMTSWAHGHSAEQRENAGARFDNHCQQCGKESEQLVVHHPNRLRKLRQRKLGPANVIQSAQEQEIKLLCPACHQQHHHGAWQH